MTKKQKYDFEDMRKHWQTKIKESIKIGEDFALQGDFTFARLSFESAKQDIDLLAQLHKHHHEVCEEILKQSNADRTL